MSRYGSRDAPLQRKVYVGDLPREATEKDLDRAFSYYGPLRSVWVARSPPGFAFIEFEDDRDADDAVRGLDNTTICGGRVQVEHSTGRSKPKPWNRGGGGGGGDRGGDRSYDRGGDRGGDRRGPPRMRKPFDSSDRCYDCGERGHYAYDCRAKRGGGGGSSRRRSRSRSPAERRQRSYSRSRSRSRGRYRTASRSPRRDRNRSRSKSRSRSPYKSSARSKSRSISPSRNGGN